MKEYGIKLGTMLFTMVEPRPGHEVEYNRWYERDHFYAGCMVGAWNFSGARFVATRRLKDLRYPRQPNPITPDPGAGSYLALYWILAGHHDEWNRWAVDQVNWLHENDRMFAERDHIHTLLYRYEWGAQRDPEGVSAELALDHRYPGLVAVVGELADGVDPAQLASWYRDDLLPPIMGESGSSVSQVLAFSPLPLLGDAPGDVPRAEASDRRFLHLWFLDRDPEQEWDRGACLGDHGTALEKAGMGRVLFASPFVPTVVGTDTYADELA
ncbi:MAG: hypothetical protein ACYDAD_04840 [Acidimicrobiales bacterium]